MINGVLALVLFTIGPMGVWTHPVNIFLIHLTSHQLDKKKVNLSKESIHSISHLGQGPRISNSRKQMNLKDMAQSVQIFVSYFSAQQRTVTINKELKNQADRMAHLSFCPQLF